MKQEFYINPDIKKAETLPATFYKSLEVFDILKEKIFLKSWHWVGDDNLIPLSESVFPFVLHDHFLNEPMVLSRDQSDQIKCFSNVCTHRGNIIVHNPGKARSLNCMYHGRRFNLDGSFKSMPEFEEAENFPRPCDSLFEFPIKKWNHLLFVGLQPVIDFDAILKHMNQRVGFLPIHEFKLEKSLNRDYLVNCHWALYCDNYLEGFHIPFVHKDLNEVLDYEEYTTELYEHMVLQVGYTDKAEEVFELPEGHIDSGKKVAAYYFWIFPNMMFNFYPWGLSINIVKPLSPDKTRVSFISYVYDEKKLQHGAGGILDKVEREDEFVVEGVHKGLQSRFYKTGRFSPSKEQGVHHFHKLLSHFIIH